MLKDTKQGEQQEQLQQTVTGIEPVILNFGDDIIWNFGTGTNLEPPNPLSQETSYQTDILGQSPSGQSTGMPLVEIL